MEFYCLGVVKCIHREASNICVTKSKAIRTRGPRKGVTESLLSRKQSQCWEQARMGVRGEQGTIAPGIGGNRDGVSSRHWANKLGGVGMANNMGSISKGDGNIGDCARGSLDTWASS